jgi:proline dehydrogenase
VPVLQSVSRSLTPLLAGRLVAGPGIEDAVRVAGELVSDGRRVALEHAPLPGAARAELVALIARVHASGLAAACELTLPAEHLELAAVAARVGLSVVLAGEVDTPPPGAGVVVPAGSADAEARCRTLGSRRVRLAESRGSAADLSFVRCLNVLMAADGRPEIATSDRRLIAIAGERAAWYGRTPESWEHVMPYGVLTDEQHRLVAGGYAVRVAVPSGPGAVSALARRLGGRA